MAKIGAILCLILLTSCGGDDSMAMKDGWAKTGELKVGISNPGNWTMQADFARRIVNGENVGGSGADYYTVQFRMKPPASGIFDTIAELIWSTEGSDVRRVVSVGNGVSISGTAQAVHVSVIDRTIPALYNPPIDVTGQSYRVDALVTPGTRPSEQQPPRLTPAYTGPIPPVNPGGPGFQTVPGGGGFDFEIDQNAGVISARVAVIAGAGIAVPPGATSVSFVNAAGLNGGVYDPIVENDWVPVPVTAAILRVANSTIMPLEFTVVFGIEG